MGVVSCGTTMLDQGVFENIGAVTWDTTVKTSGFTAVSGNGYFCNTTSAAFTVTLPSSPSAGDIVGIKDYANTADTNNITIGRNGSNIQGEAADFIIDIEGRSVLLVYVDATKGWLVTSASQASDIAIPPSFVTATGGTITTCGDFKIHTFTGPGTFCVSQVSCTPAENTVGYMVIAGGGGGGSTRGGGAGAGGFREGRNVPIDNFSASPLVANAPTNAITVTATAYPITVGAGGPADPRTPGSNSVFSTITSTGGGDSPSNGNPGGSGGGANGRFARSGGSGNSPPVSPPQGNNGSPSSGANAGNDNYAGSGAGGAGASGSGNPNGLNGGAGGAGVTTSITGSPTTYAGGGGGGSGSSTQTSGSNGGAGGSGGGGDGKGSNDRPVIGGAGGINTGGGGGGSGIATPSNSGPGGAGGSGIVVIRYKFQ